MASSKADQHNEEADEADENQNQRRGWSTEVEGFLFEEWPFETPPTQQSKNVGLFLVIWLLSKGPAFYGGCALMN
jgi:hypothetical protein